MAPLYSPLPSGQIRLIKRLHIDEEGRLRCKLVTTDFESTSYVALSYTWGNPEDPMWSNSQSENGGDTKGPSELLVNNRYTVTIGDNLYSALTSTYLLACFKKKRRALWIDKICIDQSDVQDRSIQTNQMDRIYTDARYVFIWLGEKDATTPRVIDMIEKIGKLAFVEGEPERRLSKYPTVPRDPEEDRLSVSELRRIGLEDATMEDWRMLYAFYQRTWFSRVWTVQESALSAGNYVLWGSHRFDWSLLCHTASFLVEPSIGTVIKMKLEEADGPYARPISMKVLAAAQTTFVIDGAFKEGHYHGWALLWHWTEDISQNAILILDFLLNSTGSHSASDPRDKVFALLGILNRVCKDYNIDSQADIMADYSMSVAEVFQHTTSTILRESSSLAILCRDRGPRSTRQSGLPSWVCDHNCPGPTGSLLEWQFSENVSPAQPPFKASGDVKLGFHIESSRLQIHRWCFSNVVCTGQTCGAEKESIHFERDAHIVLARMAMGVTAADALQELFEVFAAAILALHGVEKTMSAEVWNSIFANCLDLAFIPWFHGKTLSEALEQTSPKLRRILSEDTQGWMPTLAMIEEYFEHIATIAKTYPDDESIKAGLGPELDRVWDGYLSTVCELLESRRLFLLEEGSFGVGHADLEIGDEVCIVTDGVRMPLILRAVEGRPEAFELIGEAFVDGIMYGEALNTMDEGGGVWERAFLV